MIKYIYSMDKNNKTDGRKGSTYLEFLCKNNKQTFTSDPRFIPFYKNNHFI